MRRLKTDGDSPRKAAAMTNYTNDPVVFSRWRNEMLDLIEEAK